MTTNQPELTEQPRPQNATCPKCGAEPTDESVLEHKLSDMGYFHDDVMLECADCEFSWAHGVPIGHSDEFADDLWCSACDDAWMLVHRVLPASNSVTLHLKCPNHDSPACPECGDPIDSEGPIFGPDGGLACSVCDAALSRDDFDGCYYFTTTTRHTDRKGRALVGYPGITGETDGAQAYGYPDEPTDE